MLFKIAEELLGRAVVTVAEIRRNSGSRQVNSSSRQIVPLTGRSGSKSTSGSITIEVKHVEFIFLIIQFNTVLEHSC
jgi:hypothetical protein